MVAVITKYRCEHERCGREFPNETHALECEARHRAVEETYRLFFEEANKPPRCASCPHDHHPHAVCSRRSGGTAYRCGCVCGSPATRAW